MTRERMGCVGRIQLADGVEELPIDRRIPDPALLRRRRPDLPKVGVRHLVAGDEAIDDVLLRRGAPFDDHRVEVRSDLRIREHVGEEAMLGGLAVPLTEGHDSPVSQGTHDGWHRLRCSRCRGAWDWPSRSAAGDAVGSTMAVVQPVDVASTTSSAIARVRRPRSVTRSLGQRASMSAHGSVYLHRRTARRWFRRRSRSTGGRRRA